MSLKLNESKNTASLLNSRWARRGAAALMVVGGLMAAGTAATAWADKTTPAASAPGASGPQGERAEHHGSWGERFQRAMHHRGGGEGGPMMGGMMLGGHRLERLLDDVKATDAQRTQILGINDAARTDLQKLHEEGRALHEQSLAVLTQPKLDPAAAEALRQKMLAHHDVVSKRLMTAMLDTAKVLTPEQRVKVGERMKEMQSHHDQRREHGMDERHERHGPAGEGSKS
jgi:protein CpxP